MPKSGLIPEWSEADIERVLNRFEGDVRAKAIEFYKYIGENFVNMARDKGNYTDRTGNLRSSIGFVIVEDGEILYEDYQLADKGTDRDTGVQTAKEFAQHMIGQLEGIGLVGFAGMEYAAAVEGRDGYDVIDGSTPSVARLMRETLQAMSEG
jgi:hypothetical protein